ncbi:hypothetical protein NCCP691_04200 [Noviherbaspirillum aridicola]|uniref:Uncharacterized protein n=1 Tax=Noviherbaspirillum aridicola TaxID=2849687 RepID=A0ABQ4Q055_9BURK|nr:hypothetical protein NCCP691_04200 [Noviherbaspirillum aridicola]
MAPDERSVPLAELPPPAPALPEVGQSALPAPAWPAPPFPVRSGGQLVAPLLPVAPALPDEEAPLAPDPDDDEPDPVRPGSTELPEPMVPALMPDVLLVGVCANAEVASASAVAAVSAASVVLMIIPPVEKPMTMTRLCKKRAVRGRRDRSGERS